MALAPLSGPIKPPLSGKARRLVVLLHGLGADGNDLIGLAPYWAPKMPDAEFVSPHAPEPCDMAPQGRQWFSLRDRRPEALLAGAQRAAPALDAYLDAQLARLGLDESALALVGFSQGTMMALYAGLRRARPPAAIVGYSGALVGGESLAGETRGRPPVLLVHGDADEVVPVDALFMAATSLGNAGIPVTWHVCEGMGHSIDPAGLELGLGFLNRHVHGAAGAAKAG